MSTLLPLLLLAAASGAPAERTSTGRPVLVELFTSEGCSSCPPADALLAQLAGARLGSAVVVALSEHVDYWDDQGWRDPFSSALFSARQRAYAQAFRRPSVYTPQLVVAGRREVLGSDRAAALGAIAAAAREPSGRVTGRIVAGSPAEPILEIGASWRDGVAADVFAAVVQDRAVSAVAAGENEGRTLAHVAVVRSLTAVGGGVGAWSGRATLPRAGLAGAGHVVVFVQERGGGPVHAAATIPLLP